MEEQGRSLVLFFIFILSIGCVHSQNAVAVATGTDYTFSPSIQGTFEYLVWKFGPDLVVEWEPGNDPHWYRYQDRGIFDTKTGNFTLLRVQKGDSGTYTCNYHQKNVVKSLTRTIKVIDPVSVPEVTCERKGTNVTLQCSVNPPVQAELSWRGPNGFIFAGKSVDIPDVSSPSQDVYFCTAQNELGPKEKEFNLKNCPEADKPASPYGAIAAGIIVPVLGLIAGGVYWKFFKKQAPPSGTQGERHGLNENSNSQPSNSPPPSEGTKPDVL